MFPSALDTANDLLVARNSWATLTTGAIDHLSTTIPVATTFGLQTTGGVVAIDNEVIRYTSVNATALLGCARGFDGTVAVAHNAGSAVELQIVAAHHNVLAAAILAIQGALGINPQGSEATVAAALARLSPVVHQVASSSTNWSFSHTKGRLLMVQCYAAGMPGDYLKIPDAQVYVGQQVVAAPGTSTVSITVTPARAGYVIAI